MQRIHFDNISKNWFIIMILMVSILCLLVGIFELIPFENPTIHKWITGFGFLLQALFFSRMFWFKNYVQWNKKGAIIKINAWIGKSLRFEEISKTELIGNKLVITKVNGKTVTFDLTEIVASDTQKLKKILLANTIANKI